MNRITKRTIQVPLWIILLIVAIIGVTSIIALNVNTIPTQLTSLFTGAIQDSNFSIQSQTAIFRGPNRIVIGLVLKNNDTANSHTANVTVTLLDANGDPLSNPQTQLNVNVNGGATTTLTFIFTGNGIVNSYASTFVQVDQIS